MRDFQYRGEVVCDSCFSNFRDILEFIKNPTFAAVLFTYSSGKEVTEEQQAF